MTFGTSLAGCAHLPLTVLDARRDASGGAPAGSSPTDDGVRRVVLDERDVGAQVAERVSGRDGALLVIDVHGGGPSGGRLFDVDAEHILQRVRQPVVVIGPHAELPGRQAVLVLPVDGTPEPDTLVPVVEAWSTTFGVADVRVIALDAPDPWPAGAGGGEEPLAATACRLVAALAERGIVPSVRAVPTVDVAMSLIDDVAAIRDAVVVLAAPRWPGCANHWFATLRRLIRYGSSPVVVVPADVQLGGDGSRER